MLGSIGIVDHLTPETYSQQRALQTGSPPWESEPATPTAAPTTSSTPFPASSSPAELPPAPPEELLPTTVEVTSGTQAPTLPIQEEPAQEEPAQNKPAEPSATPSPPVAPPAPTPAPALAAGPWTAVPADVQGSVRQYSGRDAANITMEIDFQVSGANPPLGSGKAVFSVAADAWIVEGSLQAPVGWTCALESRRVAICASSSVQRGGDLQFRVLTDSKGNKKNRELSYTLSGPGGLAPNKFSYNY